MVPSRIVTLSFLTIWLVFLSIMQIPIIQSIEGDPPSLYNRGDGGFTELLSSLTIYRIIKVARSVDDVWQYEPGSSVLLISGLDFFPSEIEVIQILKWVENGGKLVVLDEYRTPRPLLVKVNLSAGVFVSDMTIGECIVGGYRHRVLFNVYREIAGGTPICWAENTVVAVEIKLEKGIMVVIGDSSIFINEVLRSQYRAAQLSLALSLLNRSTLIFYEGGRSFRELAFSPRNIISFLYYVGRFAWAALLGDSPLGTLKLVLAGLVLLALVSPRSLEDLVELVRLKRREAAEPRIDKLFRESINVWSEWVKKLGK